jgi:hypothetical protein
MRVDNKCNEFQELQLLVIIGNIVQYLNIQKQKNIPVIAIYFSFIAGPGAEPIFSCFIFQ